MPKPKQMYANKADLGRIFGVSPMTVYRRVQEIEKEIGKRYNKYAIIDNLISIAVFADYEKYRKHLADKNLRKYIPPFEISEVERYLDKRGVKWA